MGREHQESEGEGEEEEEEEGGMSDEDDEEGGHHKGDTTKSLFEEPKVSVHYYQGAGPFTCQCEW